MELSPSSFTRHSELAEVTTLIHPHEIPSTQQAIDDYRQQGGTLFDPELVGH